MAHRIPYLVGLMAVLFCGIPSLQAETLEELYQAATTAEKGRGDLKEAIRLYEKVVKRHQEEGTGAHLAARAQIRIGACQEKLGLKQARVTYEQVAQEFADQPEAVDTASRRIQLTHQREAQVERQAQVELEALAEDLDARDIALRGTEVELDSLAEDLDARDIHLEGAVVEEPEVQRWASQDQFYYRDQVHSGGQFASYAFTQPNIPYHHQSVARVPMRWKFMLGFGPLHPQQGETYSRQDFDDGHWAEISIGQAWEDQGYERHDGGAWYRAEIDIDARDEDKPILMAFGGVDMHGYVYINGRYAGEHHIWSEPFILDVTDAVVPRGRNAVAIYVYDGQGMGGIYGTISLHQPTADMILERFVTTKRSEDPVYITTSIQELRVGPSLARGTGISRSRYSSYSSRYSSYSRAFRQPVIPYAHRTVAQVPLAWSFILDYERGGQGKGAHYSRLDFDASGWSRISVGQTWEDQGYPHHDGGAWYRTEIDIYAQDDDAPILMAFGGIDEDGYVYINGKYVGEHHESEQPFILDVSHAVDRNGSNAVAICVHDRSGTGGIHGMIDLHQPTTESDVTSYVANQGGSLEDHDKSGRGLLSIFRRRKRYAPYAYTQPQIAYPYRSVALVPTEWRFTLDHGKSTVEHHENYPRVDFDDSDWSKIEIGQAWEDQGHRNYDEGAWYRAMIDIDAQDDEKPIHMAFGGIDKDAWVYVNGQLVGEHHAWDRSFILDISEAAEYHGENVVAIRVYDGQDMGGIYGTIDIHQPITDVDLESYRY